MVVPQCRSEGHTGSCGGRGYTGVRSDEELTWIGEGFEDRGSAGKARTLISNDERAIVNAASCIEVILMFVPIIRPTMDSTIQSTLRKILKDRSRI